MVSRRQYHSRRMRTHQSTLTRLDNIFKPIESMFEDSVDPSGFSSGRYAQKRREEKLARPLPCISRYLESKGLGSPKTSAEFRALVGSKPLAVRFLDQLKPKAKFITGALKEQDLPLATLPEVAVVGRSNVGKSSLINGIVGTRCCEVKNSPGSTKELIFYRVGDPPLISFVDVPGFGFAYESESTRTQWAEFSLWYLRARRNLRCVILVTDARHGLADSDLELISFFKKNKINFKIVLNKCDLVERSVLGKRLSVLFRDLAIPESQYFNHIVPVSALRRVGLEQIRSICELYKLKRDVVIGGNRRQVIDLLEERRLRRQQKRKSDNPVLPPNESASEMEQRAYKPDATSIVKRGPTSESCELGGDMKILGFEDFVSDDEIINLGIRGGSRRSDVPAPDPETENTNYEAKMKLNHSLDWKTQLELDSSNDATVYGSELKSQKKSDVIQQDVSALGFISFDDNTSKSVPKGIKKWKVMGMKPVIKTSRKKPKPETAHRILSRKHNST